jgi:uncharacterized phosphosugar-binding protein
VAHGGVVHTFGAGHSHLVAEDIFIRAATLTTVRSIWPDQRTERFERVSGLGPSVVERAGIRAGDVLVVISNSGINPLPIEVAVEGNGRGAITVGIGSREHTMSVTPRHPPGIRLLDVCDHFLDTRVPSGDAILELSGLAVPIGPASTIAGMALIHAVMSEAIAWMHDQGHEPPVRRSRNLPGGDEHNDALGRRYADRIPELLFGR